MKIAFSFLSTLALAQAFSSYPVAFVSRAAIGACSPAMCVPTLLRSGGPEDEEEGLDLNLEEMFEMFDSADKEESFDDAVKKIKSED